MHNEKKELLKKKLEENRKRQEELLCEKQKQSIINEIVDFNSRYRFASKDEAYKIEHFISKLEFDSPCHIVTNKEECNANHENMFLCFLCGTEELFQIYIYGKYEDLMHDYDNWDYFSPYLLLIDEDFIHYIYIKDNGKISECKISE